MPRKVNRKKLTPRLPPPETELYKLFKPSPVPGRILAYGLADGRLVEIFRITHKVYVEAVKMDKRLQRSYVLSKALKIDGMSVTLEETLDLDQNDAEYLTNCVFKAMATRAS